MILKVPSGFHSFLWFSFYISFSSMVRISVAVFSTRKPHLGTKSWLLTVVMRRRRRKKTLCGKPGVPIQVQGSEARPLGIAPKPVSTLSTFYSDAFCHRRTEGRKGYLPTIQERQRTASTCSALFAPIQPPALSSNPDRKTWMNCFHFYFTGVCVPSLTSLIQILFV